MVSLKQKIVALTLIIFLGAYFQFKHLQDFPQHVHAWSQSDRYAIALGFLHNDLNFFKPETFVYNHQFPDNFLTPSSHTITSVDFPIHDYCVAILMKISGSKSPWIFRVYILIFSFLGLYYLFKLTFLFTSNFYKSLFVMLFAATSPVFVYYQSGFLPTIPSLSFAIVGIYCYSVFKWRDGAGHNYFRLSLIFLVLAALSRLTFAIPLIAISGMEFLYFVRQKKINFSALITIAASFSVLIGYNLYNRYLTNTYGSLFLNHLLPPKNMDEAFNILKDVKGTWLFDYFTKYHFLAFGLLLLVSLKGLWSSFKLKLNLFLMLLIGVISLGAVSFFLLMMKQFQAHDYYFLDTFFLPFVLLMILVIGNFQARTPLFKLISLGLVAVFFFVVGQKLIESQAKRYDVGSWNRVAQTVTNYQDSEAFLEDKKIPADAKLLVVGHFGPNIPFILMNRKGYLIKNASPYYFNKSKQWGIDYYIFQNEFFPTEELAANPDLINQLEMKYTNDKIMLCKLRSTPISTTLMTFLGLDKKIPRHLFQNDFEVGKKNYWAYDSLRFENKNQMVVIESTNPHGLSYKRFDVPIIKRKSAMVVVSAGVNFLKRTDCEVVVALTKNGEILSYQTRNLKDIIKKVNQKQKVDMVFNLPKVEGEGVEFSVFIYNTGSAKMELDDFVIKLF